MDKSHHMPAVLCSGGLDSVVLLADELARAGSALPIHVRAGLAWEDAEARALVHVLSLPPFADRTRPLATLAVDMREIYPPGHWAVIGEPPAYDTPDEDVYLEGRNIVLIGKASVLCARLGIERLALGPLAGNPFPDSTTDFFETMGRAMSLGLGRRLEVVAPFAKLHKADVIRRGLALGVPLEATLSCMRPAGDQHCGRCSKCRERRDAFAEAGVADPTSYI